MMNVISVRTKQHLKEFADDIKKHEIFLLAAAIAFTTALALAPFVLILLSVASLLGPEMQTKLFESLSSNVGPKAGEAVLDIVKNTKERPSLAGFSSLIGFVVLVISASAIFTQLRIALNKINEHRADKKEAGIMGFIKDKVFSVGLVFGFAFLSVVSLILSSTLTAIFPGGEGLIWQSVAFLMSFIMFGVIFTLMYRFIPTDKMNWKTCTISGLVSTFFYLIGKNLIGLYLGKAGVGSAYGAAGSLIAFLAWVYYTAVTLLVSYEFSKVIVSKRTGKMKDLRPKKHRKASQYASI